MFGVMGRLFIPDTEIKCPDFVVYEKNALPLHRKL